MELRKKNLLRMVIAAIRGNLEEYFAEEDHYEIENHQDVLHNKDSPLSITIDKTDYESKPFDTEQELTTIIWKKLENLSCGSQMLIGIWDCTVIVKISSL